MSKQNNARSARAIGPSRGRVTPILKQFGAVIVVSMILAGTAIDANAQLHAKREAKIGESGQPQNVKGGTTVRVVVNAKVNEAEFAKIAEQVKPVI